MRPKNPETSVEKNAEKAQLPLTAEHWELLQEMILLEGSESLSLTEEVEARFTAQEEGKFSLLIAVNGLDALHFCWQEVDGVFDVDHRIVQPQFRGNGYATKFLQMLEQRCLRKALKSGTRQLFMMDTHQESIVKLGQKIGMQLTKGQDRYHQFQKHPEKFRVLEDSTIVDDNDYALNLRVTKLIEPVENAERNPDGVIKFARNNVFELLSAPLAA
jgi:GNAT superfamily N-acetyltransferase